MTGLQPKDESVGNSSEDDETLGTLLKCKRPSKRTHSTDRHSPGHSSDDEPLNKLKSKGSPPDSSDKHQDTDANKMKSQKKQKMKVKASKLRQTSPSRVKATPKRGRKSKKESKGIASARPTPKHATSKRRGRPTKKDSERKAPSDDGSEEEPLVQLMKKKSQPEMKEAVVLLKRMSKSDVIDLITQRHTHGRERSSAASGGAGSDDDPVVRRAKAVKNKCGKRTNGEEDSSKQALKSDSDDECLVKRKSDRAAQSLH